MIQKSNYKFYMQQYPTTDAEGTTTVVKDLQADFKGLAYKSMSGIENYGKPNVYTEKFAESEKLSVYIPSAYVFEQTDLVLTLYFFGDADLGITGTKTSRDYYHDFMGYVKGKHLLYWDDARKRKALMYLSDSTTPTTDTIYGVPYIEVQFKFKNEYGHSFDVTETVK